MKNWDKVTLNNSPNETYKSGKAGMKPKMSPSCDLSLPAISILVSLRLGSFYKQNEAQQNQLPLDGAHILSKFICMGLLVLYFQNIAEEFLSEYFMNMNCRNAEKQPSTRLWESALPVSRADL